MAGGRQRHSRRDAAVSVEPPALWTTLHATPRVDRAAPHVADASAAG